MEKDRQTKIIAIVALFIGVATLTLGFATFSANLIIKSRATVTPDADSFKVLLSKEQNSVIVGKVSPIGVGEEATISNEGIPTISGLKANFVNPGEQVVYEFYAVNTGDLDAFLNKIEFNDVAGQSTNKLCTAGENTTNEYVQNACNSIRVTVKVAEDDKACQTSTYNGHKLVKKNGEKVVVTIEYNKEGARADGPFEVEFGDITLNYSTVDTEIKNVLECEEYMSSPASVLAIRGRTNIVDNDNDGKISLSDKVTLRANVNDKVTLGTESFYVMSTDESAGTVTMLAEWNLNVGDYTVPGVIGLQNSQCNKSAGSGNLSCAIAFSNSLYWSGSSYVYNNKSNAYSYVENYVTKLKNNGYGSVTGRLIKREELITLGCLSDGGEFGTCSNAPSWLLNNRYWTGSSKTASGNIWYMAGGISLTYCGYYNKGSIGVRPVITIKASEI